MNLLAERALAAVGAQFDVTRPTDKSNVWEKTFVLLIIIAAAIVRFWGLGSWGLEGDEETMAMPTMHIVTHGTPVLPSGMFYARAIAQLYLMAASVMAFGQSEWALRFPSVICSLVLIVLAYFYGRRFLSTAWNLAFVAIVAFLPGMIADAQEARMYIFLSASLAAYAICVFRWERSNRTRDLMMAVAVMLVGIQFHTLCIFGAFLIFFPGLLQGDVRKLAHGVVAFGLMVAGFVLIDHWIASFYPPRPQIFGVERTAAQLPWGILKIHANVYLMCLGLGASAAAATAVARRVSPRWALAASWGLVLLGFCFQLGMFYHVAVIALVLGVVVARRYGGASLASVAGVFALAALIAVLHVMALHAAGVTTLRKTIGAMIGLPSIWTYLNLGIYSPIAMLVAIAVVGHALWLFASHRKIQDYHLFMILGVWLPLFGLGIFGWFVDSRYTEFALLPLLACVLAAVQYAWRKLTQTHPRYATTKAVAAAAFVTAVLTVNPLSATRVINAGYTIHPDHKGAAEYIKSIQLGPRDILLAEDVLQQTYYLGHVDYWLENKDDANLFVENFHGKILDIYTHTPVIGTGDELAALVAKRDRGAIYVLGSGEGQEDGRRYMRAYGIFEMLESPQFKVVYEGRDGFTKVWKVDPPDSNESRP